MRIATYYLGEITFTEDDLAFSPKEIAEVLDLPTSPLHEEAASEELLHDLTDKTKGWIKGVKLAERMAERRAPGSRINLDGSNRIVREYFLGQVLRPLPHNLLDLLTKLSPFERFNKEFVSHVFGDDLVPAFTSLLEQNAFVMRRDTDDAWYRIHPLLKDILNRDLLRLKVEDVRWACLLASEWFHERSCFSEAAKYLIMSSDTGYAESLVEAIYSLSRPRKETNPLLWLCEIESTQFEDSPLLCMLAAWTCVTTARLADADRWTKALERVMAQEENKAAISPELASFAVKCLRMKYLAMAGDGTRALQLCDELLNCGQEVKPSLRSMINQSEAEAYESTGNYEQAMELYLKAQASATVDNTMHQLFFNEYTYALALYYRGEHADALKCCEDILKKCPEDFAIYGASCSLLARVLIEVDEIDRVPELIDTSLNRLSHYRHIDLYLDIKMAQSIWLASRGRASDAYEAIVEATIHGEQYEHVPRATLLSAYYLQAGMAKKQRNTRELKIIEQKFSNIVHDEDLFNQLLLLTIRAYILELDDRKREAATMFDQAFTQAHAKNFNRMGLNALVEKTMLLSALGEKTKTQAALSELIHVASKQGFARTILSAGEPLRQLLRDFSTSRNANGPMRTFTKALLLKFEKERPSTEGRPNGDEGLFANDASELTEREVEVLKLLNMGMQRQEIAEVLCISINTVKKHLANIYTKLGVKSRNEAIERITL